MTDGAQAADEEFVGGGVRLGLGFWSRTASSIAGMAVPRIGRRSRLDRDHCNRGQEPGPAGKLKALAVTSKTRWKRLPDVPTADGRVSRVDGSSWAGIAAPRGTPKTIIDRLHAEMKRVLKLDEVRGRLEAFGGEVHGSTPEEMRARAREVERWAKVIRDSKIEQP